MTRPHRPIAVRPYRADDATDIRQLTERELDRTEYRSGPRSAINGVVDGTDGDSQCLVAVNHDDAIVGFIVHGTLAGSEGAGRVQLLVTEPGFRRTGIARRLAEAAMGDLRSAGVRFIVVEMPDDPALAPARSLFETGGFREEARVRDFYRDGIDLAVLRHDIDGP